MLSVPLNELPRRERRRGPAPSRFARRGRAQASRGRWPGACKFDRAGKESRIRNIEKTIVVGLALVLGTAMQARAAEPAKQ
jgi:hypothetical protein